MTLPPNIAEQVAAALAEDVGAGDVTAQLVPAGQRVEARISTREDAVICGTAWVDETFRQLDREVVVKWSTADGEKVEAGALLCVVAGAARPILSGERTALNFLQTLSATATATRRYVDALAGTDCTILDTRKTLPGLRLAQKYATRCGGAHNHRLGLHDMVLIKENHVLACGSIAGAIAAARRTAPGVRVEVEVESLSELEQALDANPDIVLLDEFTHADLREAVRRNRARGSPVRLEASGGISIETVRTIAQTGVDFISIGAITKHVRAVDLTMRVDFAGA